MNADVSDTALQQLAEQLGHVARSHHHSLVTAESCTGGWIAKILTDIAGSSGWFECGMAAYSYEAKQALLGVRPQTLEEFGAVSRETVIEMVSGALVHSAATLAVAVTGIAGPGGGTPEKPVGTVCFAWAGKDGGCTAQTCHFVGERAVVREQAVRHALLGLQSCLDAAISVA